MIYHYSDSIQKLITAFSTLPGVGQRTAERFVFHLLKSGKKEVSELTLALKNLIEKVKSCETCWSFSEENPCLICNNLKRNKNIICVVKDQQEMEAFEKLKSYNGVYHILRGTFSHDDPNSPILKMKELIRRIDKNTIEIILALNPDLSGETTMMILEKKIKEINPQIKITRLARGLAMGADLQYADEITLENALKNRK